VRQRGRCCPLFFRKRQWLGFRFLRPGQWLVRFLRARIIGRFVRKRIERRRLVRQFREFWQW
jgi:hypothetical protein